MSNSCNLVDIHRYFYEDDYLNYSWSNDKIDYIFFSQTILEAGAII